MIILYFVIALCFGYIFGVLITILWDEGKMLQNLKLWKMRKLGRNCTNCKYKTLNCTYGSERCHCPAKGEYNPCTGEIDVKEKWIQSTVGTKYCNWKPKEDETK